MLIHEREQEDDALREMETMRRIDHPNLLPLILGEIEEEPHPPSTSYVIASPARTPPRGWREGARRCHTVFPAYPEGNCAGPMREQTCRQGVHAVTAPRHRLPAVPRVGAHARWESRTTTSSRATSCWNSVMD